MPLTSSDLLNHRYRILRTLGRGGMGAVYLATDESLGVEVAVKENLNLSPESERQFKREATLLAGLRHNHLPRVTDHFVLADHQYLIMDYVEGEDLQARLKRLGPLPEAEVIAWATQIAGALTYLHTQDPPVIHRDIKPSNIKLTTSGEAMLVDFGLAKATQMGQKTTTGALGVTPGFAPPEQYGTGSTDARTDEYALTATLYNLLTGQLPPDSMDRLVGTSRLTPITELRPDLPPHVAATIERAFGLRPIERLPDLETFRAALSGEIPLPPPVVTAAPRRPRLLPDTAQVEPAPTLQPEPTPRPPSPVLLGLRAGFNFLLLATLILGGYYFLMTLLPFWVSDWLTASQEAQVTAPLATARAFATPAPATASPTEALATPNITLAPTLVAHATTAPNPGASGPPELLTVANARGLASLGTLPATTAGTAPFALSPDGELIAIPSTEGFDVYKIVTGEKISSAQGFLRSRRIQALAFRGDEVFVQMPDEILRWSLTRGIFGERFSIAGSGLVLSPDLALMALTGDRVINIFEIETGRGLANIGSPDVNYFYAFSPDHTRIALADGGTALELWDTATGALAVRLNGHGEPIRQLVFSADGSLLVAASGDVWDLATGALFATFDSSTDLVAVSPDAQLIFGADGSVWTTSNGKQLATVNLPAPSRMIFTPDQKQLIVQAGNQVAYYGSRAGADIASGATPTAVAAAPTREAIARLNVSRLINQERLGTGNYVHLALSPDGYTLAALSVAGIDFFDTATRQQKDSLTGLGRLTEIGYLGNDFMLVVKASGTVERWDLATKTAKQSYNYIGHGLTLSPDGKLFALQDKYIQVIEVASGKILHSLGSADAPHSFLFTPDSKYLAITSGTAVGLWDVTTGQNTGTAGGHGIQTTGLAFANGKMAAASGDVWDLTTTDPLAAFTSNTPGLAVSPDATLILGYDGSAWDGETGQFVGTLAGVDSAIASALFTPDSQQVFWLTSGGALQAWALRKMTSTWSDAPDASLNSGVIVSPSVTNLALAGWWGTDAFLQSRLVRDSANLPVEIYSGESYATFALAPDGQTFGAVSRAGVDMLDLTSGDLTGRFRDFLDPDQIAEIAFTHDSLLVLKTYGGVERWDLTDQTLTQRYNVFGHSLTASPDGQWLAVQLDRAVQVLDAASGAIVYSLSPATAQHAFAFTPDSQFIVIANAETVTVYDLATGKRARTMRGHTGKTGGLVFNAGGTQLLAASGDVWDFASGTLLVKYTSTASQIALSPQAELVEAHLLAGDDGLIRSVATGEIVATLTEARGRALHLAFSPDGQQLLWHTAANVIYAWRLTEEKFTPPVSVASSAITAANAKDLALQKWWGKGRLLNAHWSPDEKYLAVNTPQNTIIYSGDDLAPVQTYWQSAVLALDGQGRAVITTTAGLQLIEVASGQVQATFPITGITVAVFQRDGKTLAVGGGFGQTKNLDGVGLLTLSTGALQMLEEPKGFYKGLTELSYSPDGKILLETLQGALTLWDVATGKKVRATIPNVTRPPSVSPSGKYIAYFTNKFVVESLVEGGVLREINADGTPYFASGVDIDPFRPLTYALLSDDELLVFYQRVRGRDLALVKWSGLGSSVSQQLLLNSFGDFDEMSGLYSATYLADRLARVPALGLSPAGKKFFTLTEDGAARVWDVASGQTQATTAPDYVNDFTLALDGKTALLPDALGGLARLDLASGGVETQRGNWFPARMAFMSERLILLMHGDGQLTYLDWDTGRAAEDASGDLFRIPGFFAATPDHQLFALWQTARPRNFLNVFGYDLAQPAHTFGSFTKAEAFAFSPDGALLAIVNGKNIELWNTQTRARVGVIASTRKTVGALVFSPDGQRLYTAGGDLAEIASLSVVASFDSQATQIALSPNGQVLVGDDGAVWDTASGALLTTLSQTGGRAAHLAFTPDGKTLIWQTGEGVGEVWGR